MKFSKNKMISRSEQILTGGWLVGLLLILTVTQACTEGEDFLADRSSAIANSTQPIESDRVDLQDAQTLEQRNKKIVQQYFDDWQNGNGNFFDLLAPNAVWTITGSGAMVGTYQKQELVDKVIVPFNARLSAPIVPTVRGIWADGDMVIALWDDVDVNEVIVRPTASAF